MRQFRLGDQVAFTDQADEDRESTVIGIVGGQYLLEGEYGMGGPVYVRAADEVRPVTRDEDKK